VEAAIAQKAADDSLTLKQLASDHGVSYYILWRRWQRYTIARAAGDAAGMADAAVSHRGGHNRAFTSLQEGVLRDIVLAAAPAMGHQQIKEAALEMAADVRVDAAGGRALRHHRAFTASDALCLLSNSATVCPPTAAPSSTSANVSALLATFLKNASNSSRRCAVRLRNSAQRECSIWTRLRRKCATCRSLPSSPLE
jgi:hypothetical protein